MTARTAQSSLRTIFSAERLVTLLEIQRPRTFSGQVVLSCFYWRLTSAWESSNNRLISWNGSCVVGWASLTGAIQQLIQRRVSQQSIPIEKKITELYFLLHPIRTLEVERRLLQIQWIRSIPLCNTKEEYLWVFVYIIQYFLRHMYLIYVQKEVNIMRLFPGSGSNTYLIYHRLYLIFYLILSYYILI